MHDEGKSHHGPAGITAWWLAAWAKYHHHADPLELEQTAGKTVVRAQVRGDFPGSPAILTFRFGVADNRVTDLEIGA